MRQGHEVPSGTLCLFYLIPLNNWMDNCTGKGCFYNVTWVEIFFQWRLLTTLQKYSWKTACIHLKGLLKSRLSSSIANASRNRTDLCFSFYLSSILHQMPHDCGLAGPSCHVQRRFSSLGKKSRNKVTAAPKKSSLLHLHEAYDVGFIFYR